MKKAFNPEELQKESGISILHSEQYTGEASLANEYASCFFMI
jgi:hypothetical protein